MTSDPSQKALNTLLRGVAHDASDDIRDGWRSLVKIGTPVVPVVREKLRESDWSDYQGRTEARYLTVLLMLLAELDAVVCEQETERLEASPLHNLHARTVGLVGERLKDEVHEFECRGVSVRIDAQLSDPKDIQRRLTRWMQIPSPDAFKHLQKIDIVPKHPSFDYLGL